MNINIIIHPRRFNDNGVSIQANTLKVIRRYLIERGRLYALASRIPVGLERWHDRNPGHKVIHFDAWEANTRWLEQRVQYPACNCYAHGLQYICCEG